MNRHVKRVDTHHDLIGFEMQSASERDSWERAMPNPLPSTHEQYVEWDNATGIVWIGVRLKKGVSEAQAKAALEKGSSNPRIQSGERTHDDLMKLSLPDLETLAVELGITVGPTWKKPAYIASILEKQAAKAAAAG